MYSEKIFISLSLILCMTVHLYPLRLVLTVSDRKPKIAVAYARLSFIYFLCKRRLVLVLWLSGFPIVSMELLLHPQQKPPTSWPLASQPPHRQPSQQEGGKGTRLNLDKRFPLCIRTQPQGNA